MLAEAGLSAATMLGLAGAAFFAAALDAIAGGGGLIAVPALLLAGFDPVTALATNKAQGAVGALSSAFAFARRGYAPWREAAPAAACAALGGLGGAFAAHLAPRALLVAAAPVVLVAAAFYFARGRTLRAEPAAPRLGLTAFAVTFATAIGFYDGIFGPGAGAFYLAGFVGLRGLGALTAVGAVKLVNAASNMAALSFFVAAGHVAWPAALAMAGAALVGAQIGARIAMHYGARAIRPLIVVACMAMALRLLADPANPLTGAALRVLGF